jgi:hypothetical protein
LNKAEIKEEEFKVPISEKIEIWRLSNVYNIQAHRERGVQWQALRNRKCHLGVMLLG